MHTPMKIVYTCLILMLVLSITGTCQQVSTLDSASIKQPPGNQGMQNIKGVALSWQSGRLKNATDCSIKSCDYLADGMSHKGTCPSYTITITLKNTNKYKV